MFKTPILINCFILLVPTVQDTFGMLTIRFGQTKRQIGEHLTGGRVIRIKIPIDEDEFGLGCAHGPLCLVGVGISAILACLGSLQYINSLAYR